MYRIINFIFILITLFFIEAFTLSKVEGQEMTSENYKIEGGNFNTGSSAQSSTGFRLVDLIGQTPSQIFTARGYILKTNPPNNTNVGSLNFSISPNIVSFERIGENSHITSNLVLTVTSANFPGYSVYTYQNNPLSTENGIEIADTVCDSTDENDCTINKANIWQKTNSYGFGYSLKGKIIPSDFNSPLYYRPFPSRSKNENPILIMSSDKEKTTDIANMTLKIIAPKTQAEGLYKNIITFLAIPGF